MTNNLIDDCCELCGGKHGELRHAYRALRGMIVTGDGLAVRTEVRLAYTNCQKICGKNTVTKRRRQSLLYRSGNRAILANTAHQLKDAIRFLEIGQPSEALQICQEALNRIEGGQS